MTDRKWILVEDPKPTPRERLIDALRCGLIPAEVWAEQTAADKEWLYERAAVPFADIADELEDEEDSARAAHGEG